MPWNSSKALDYSLAGIVLCYDRIDSRNLVTTLAICAYSCKVCAFDFDGIVKKWFESIGNECGDFLDGYIKNGSRDLSDFGLKSRGSGKEFEIVSAL